MTLRLSATEDETLAQLAKTFRTSKNLAVAAAIDLAARKQDHRDFVEASTRRLLERHSALLGRLAES